MAEEGKGEEDRRDKKRKQGGFKTMPYILGNDVCDQLATIGTTTNLITYLTKQLHLPLVQASNTLTIFNGTANLTPLIGGLIADSFAGRFWTIFVASIAYQLGILILTLSAIIPSLHPSSHKASTGQLLVLYASLLCISIGTGGVRPCTMAFGADQFELSNGQAKARMSKWSFFNLYFCGIQLAKILAVTVVVYIQENVGWGWGLGVPTIAMFFGVLAFISGSRLYVKMAPGHSPLTRMAQVVVAAFRKRNTALPADSTLLYQDKELDAGITTTERLLHTDQLKFFDRAAIVTEDDIPNSTHPRPWRLSTVHRVEELKSIIHILPIWAAGILFVTASSHNSSFAIQQGRTMNRHLSRRFQIPPATMLLFTDIAMLLTLAVYDRILIPVGRHFTKKPSGITHLQRIGIGLVFSILANAIAAIVEAKRRSVAVAHGLLDDPKATVPISIFWLAPQYVTHGIANAFIDVGRMEFLYDQAPESMRSTAAALYWLAMSIGEYVGTMVVALVHVKTRKMGEWLQDNLNKGKLDYYYWLVVGLQGLDLLYFVVCVKYYRYKPLEVVGDENGTAAMVDYKKKVGNN